MTFNFCHLKITCVFFDGRCGSSDTHHDIIEDIEDRTNYQRGVDQKEYSHEPKWHSYHPGKILTNSQNPAVFRRRIIQVPIEPADQTVCDQYTEEKRGNADEDSYKIHL